MPPQIRLSTILIVAALLIVTAACAPAEEVVEVPTLMVLPSLTPSNTPTQTSTPTETSTPTSTPTLTMTFTFTPSFTPTSSPTLRPTGTLTSTRTPTFTATFTPPVTATAPGPVIVSFTASTLSITAGGSLTLTWTSQADSARVEQLDSQGTVRQVFNVTPSGTLPVTVPTGQGNQIVYRLVATRSGQEVTASVTINIACTINWFFGNELAPPGSGCPTGTQVAAPGAFQPFERGLMIYITANNQKQVYGLQNTDNRYIGYQSTWDGVTVYNCPEIANPPSGLFAPQGVFGWAYCSTNAPVGIWKDAVGWATTTNIDGTPRTIQTSDTGVFFIDIPTTTVTPGGGVYRFSGGDAGTWQKVK